MPLDSQFCNKLWNATKFAMAKLDPKTSLAADAGPLLDADGSRLYPAFVPAPSEKVGSLAFHSFELR